MPLQIRRGLDSERGSITFLDGELVYSKDTGTLWIGDGVTAGGVSLASGGGGGATNLNGLTDVTISSPSNGQVLKYNSSTGQWVNGTDNSGTSLTSLDDVPGVVLTSPTNGQVLKFNGTTWVNGTDSTGVATVALNDVTDVVINAPSTGQVLKYNGSVWINDTDLNTGTGTLALADISDVNLNTPTTGQVLKFDGSSWTNDINISSINDLIDVDASGAQLNEYLSFNGSNWISKPLDIAEDLSPNLGGNLDLNSFDINGFGNISINGNIQGNIVTSSIVTPNGNITLSHTVDSSPTRLIVTSKDQGSVLKLVRTSDSDLSSIDTDYGYITFERLDVSGVPVASGLIQVSRDRFIIAANSTGSFAVSDTLTLQSSAQGINLGVRTTIPTEALDVRGNGKFLGFVQFGSFTSVERDALTPTFGMVIYNTTTNTFQGYQNTGGATPEWINLS